MLDLWVEYEMNNNTYLIYEADLIVIGMIQVLRGLFSIGARALIVRVSSVSGTF